MTDKYFVLNDGDVHVCHCCERALHESEEDELMEHFEGEWADLVHDIPAYYYSICKECSKKCVNRSTNADGSWKGDCLIQNCCFYSKSKCERVCGGPS